MNNKVWIGLLVVFSIFLVTCLIFFKIFLKGLFPIPGDLLVSFYFPWYSGGWVGYDPWTTHKELLAADAVRQGYLWKEFAFGVFKQIQFPLWNPYTFSGQPLAANFQSSVYYPLNIFYFLFDPKNAWLLLVITQPFLGGLFMYMAARSFKLSSVASVFGSFTFMFSSYLITWIEINVIGHVYIWFPLSLWSINMFFREKKLRFVFILCGSLSFSTLAGHPVTIMYHYMMTSMYFIYKIWESQRKILQNFLIYFTVVAGALLISAIQLIPTYEFYSQAPLSMSFSREGFDRTIVPVKNLLTFFASDFFGNPATGNFWSQSYGDFTPYFGVIPLIFSIWAIFNLWRKKFVKFATIVLLFFIVSTVNGPVTYLIKTLQIPLLDSTTPARFFSISIFLLIILAAIGFEDFIKNFLKKKYINKFLKFLVPLAGIYIFLWFFATFGQFFLEPKETWLVNLTVTRRNLVLPTLMFLSIPIGIVVILVAKLKLKVDEIKLKAIFIIGIFIVILGGGVYFSNKFLPVAPKKFIFPDHLLFNWLKDNAGIDRFYGGGTAHIDFNFPTHYKIYGVEGYDTLRNKRYAELLASSFTGSVPSFYLRADGVVPNEENGYRKRIFELLGIKYLLDKEDNPKTGTDWHYERFPNDDVKGIWQEGKFQVYERSSALPRLFLTTNYLVVKDDQEIIEKIYDPSFNLETLILEQEPPLKIDKGNLPIVLPKILKYGPNEIVVATDLAYSSLLFLSDSYDKDWHVYIDGQKSKLMRTHYALRSTAVPKGAHQVEFKYQPQSFIQGAIISSFSIIFLIMISVYFVVKKRF